MTAKFQRIRIATTLFAVTALSIVSASFAVEAETVSTKTTTITTTTSATSSASTETAPAGQLADPVYPLTVPATSRLDAVMKARLGAGRANPFGQPAGISKIAPFNAPDVKALKPLPKMHLPPPPKFTHSELAPPPPPTEVTTPGMAMQAVGQAGRGLEADMPEPPEKPILAKKMKLVGLIGNEAFFTFTDLDLKHSNKFPSTVVLKNGEQFESVNVVSIQPNSVVLEEDGERYTKELERIR